MKGWEPSTLTNSSVHESIDPKPLKGEKDIRTRLLRQGWGVDRLYVIFMLGAVAISCVAHIGIGKLPLPGNGFGDNLQTVNELEVEWIFGSPDNTPAEPIPEPEPPRFVETNPDVPENEPDETPNESDRNQQSAQENPDPEKEKDAPTVEGETENSQKIIEGKLAEKAPKPEPGVFTLNEPPTPEKQKEEQEEDGQDSKQADAPPPPPTTPEVIEAGDGEGVSSIQQTKFESKEPTRNTIIPLELPSRPDPDSRSLKELTPQKVQPIKPKPRPRLPASVIPGPRQITRTSAARTGTLAIDAKWSEFGEYTQRMIAAISLQWHKLVYNARLDSELTSTVHVRFIINNQGVLEHIQIVETNAGKLASILCKDAISSRAPFGPWTADMMQVFGERTDVNIRFNYR